MNNIVMKVLAKLASKQPILASFYILNGNIIYNPKGVDHTALWKRFVYKYFTHLEYYTRMELANSQYACDRGRVGWTGALDAQGNPIPNTGELSLIGTKGCTPYKTKLLKLFDLPKTTKIDLGKTDDHYKILRQDKLLLEQSIKLIGDVSLEPIVEIL